MLLNASNPLLSCCPSWIQSGNPDARPHYSFCTYQHGRRRRYAPTVGTTLADFVDRSLGIGYLGGSSVLAVLLAASLALWHRTMGTVSIASINSKSAETFYWVTIMFSQTLGTALGDWMADSTGLGYAGGALVFAAGLAVVTGAYFWTNISRTVLFWVAFVLTRPLGATVGDFLDKPLDHGGLALSRYTASASLAAIMVLLIVLLPQRSGEHPA